MCNVPSQSIKCCSFTFVALSRLSVGTMFSIVKFPENEVAIVCTKWIKGDTCSWPPYKNDDAITSAVKEMEDAKPGWPTYEMVILKTYDSYAQARGKLKDAEETSDLSDHAPTKRNHKLPARYIPTESEDESSSRRSSGNKKSRLCPTFPTPPMANPSVVINRLRFTDDSQLGGSTANLHVSHQDVGNDSDDLGSSISTAISSIYDVSNDFQETAFTTPLTSCNGERNGYESQTRQPYVKQSTPHPYQRNPESRSAVNFNSESNDLLRFLARNFEVIKAKLDNVMESNTEVLRALSKNRSPDEEIHKSGHTCLPPLPLMSDEEFMSLDRQLLPIDGEPSDVYKSLVSYLKMIGGNQPEAVVRRIMQRLLSDDVVLKYSWLGLKGKKSFSKMEIVKVIFESVMNTPKCAGMVTKKIIEDEIKDWLRKATDRIKHREPKAQSSASI